jgi:hydroxypyruvate isomerase
MSGLTYTANCSILFNDVRVLEQPTAASDSGFEAVEFWWPFESPTPRDDDVDAFVRAIREAGVQLTGLNFAAGDMPGGDRGILSDPAMTRVFRDNVHVAVGIAESLGCSALNALYGNRRDGQSAEAQDAVAADNLAFAADCADHIGAVVLVEPLSGAPRYPLKTAEDAIRVIDAVVEQHGATNLGLLADLYHLYVNGDDIPAAIHRYAGRIEHVQIADAPGRGEPGTGDIPLDSFLGEIRAHGYTGYVGLEYKPTRPDTFDWLSRDGRGMHSVDITALRPREETGTQ